MRLFVLALAACGSSAVAPPPALPARPVAPDVHVEPPLPPPSPPGLRLDATAHPTHYTLDLAITPSSETFAGTVTIALEISEPIGGLWLHGADLKIDRATLRSKGVTSSATQIAATPATTEAEIIGISFGRTVTPGAAELEIRYTGKIYSNDFDGVHRQEERGSNYVFTQFESTDARRAFPCFDEPSYKVPFKITIRTHGGDLAFANTPSVVEVDGPRSTFRFAETKPLPTYLVAFAVGPFEIVDAGTAGKNHTPLRIIVTKGRSAEASYAAKTTPLIVDALEDYFGIPYPYEKLDQIAVPRKGGAMENAGLITYGLPLLLISSAEETITRKRRFTSIAAHEIAHHWFGDYVTLAWWDDTWLNESFASWMANKVVEKLQPTWAFDVSVVEGRSGSMRGDMLHSARRVHQAIATKHDIAAAFDNITYGKGSALLAMFEHWIGPDKFQRAVHDYLTAHAYGVATTKDFTAAVSAQAGIDVAPVMSSFLDQIGVPVVDVTLQCDQGHPITLHLKQQRFSLIGSAVEPQTWQLPVCVEFGVTKVDGHACTLLTQATGELELPTKTCPTWVHANAGEVGYYRVEHHPLTFDHVFAIAPKNLTRAERVGMYGDLTALVDAGRVPISTVLDRAKDLSREPDRHYIQIASGIAGYLSDEMVTKRLRPNRARFIKKLFLPRIKSLGWTSPKGEDDDQRLLRGALIGWIGTTEDPAMIATAKQLAENWLSDKQAIDPDLVGTVLAIASRFGDRAWFDKLHSAANAEKERKERGQLLGAMAGFRDPEVVKAALAIALTDEFPGYESIGLVWGALNEDTRELGYQFIKDHHDALLARLPRDSNFLGLAGVFCDEAHRKDVAAFLEDKAAKYPNGPRNLAQGLERADLCIARKRAQLPGIENFLARW